MPVPEYVPLINAPADWPASDKKVTRATQDNLGLTEGRDVQEQWRTRTGRLVTVRVDLTGHPHYVPND